MIERKQDRRNVISRTRHPRRGSVIVLVAGILILLLIVGFSYLSRTEAERTISIASQDNGRTDDRERQIGNDIAGEISEHLFVRPLIVPTNPNAPRAPVLPNAVRYGIDPTDLIDNATGAPPADGIPDFPYNHAAFEVVPWTNWPDGLRADPNDPLTAPRFDDKRGFPGVADTRWLRDTEPHRFLVDYTYPNPLNNDSAELFSHWTHWTNLTRPENGWLLVPDIANIDAATAYYSQTTTYETPVEQWLPEVAPFGYDTNPFTATGRSFILNDVQGVEFINAWLDWFSPQGYQWRYNNTPIGGPNSIDSPPPNLFQLSDIDGDLIPLEVGERPEDEFAGPGSPGFPNGSLRWYVSRAMTDTDGDGVTDAFWHLAPASADGDVRTLVAVSIVDLSGLLNANTGTMFWRGDPATTGIFSGTAGHTPADLAFFDDLPLVDVGGGQFEADGVGFLGNWQNWEVSFPGVGFAGISDQTGPYGRAEVYFEFEKWGDPGEFPRYLSELNILDQNANANMDLAAPYWNAGTGLPGRLYYWRTTGLRPFDSEDIFTPFTLADELELRKFHGHNAPWSASNFEHAIQSVAGNTEIGPVRAGNQFEETSEYLDQLRNKLIANSDLVFDELLHDNRRKLTTFSTTRNELIPPWLRWETRFGLPSFINPNDAIAVDFFTNLTRSKLDLREELRPHPDITTGTGDRTFQQRLPASLLIALSEFDLDPFNYTGQAYYDGFGSTQNNYLETRRLATALAANMLAFREADDFNGDGVDDAGTLNVFPNPSDPSSFGALPLLNGNGEEINNGVDEYYLGMEAQPFIVETFIAHVYADAGVIPPPDPDQGQNYVDDTSEVTTVVAIQLLNPFDRTIDLSQYKLSVFGQVIDISTLPGSKLLGPTREEQPRSAIFYAIADTFDGDPGFDTEWIDFLDIEPSDLFDDGSGNPDSLVFNVTSILSDDPSDYNDTSEAVELYRVAADAMNVGTIDVLIDRVDNPNDVDASEQTRFRDVVHDLQSDPQYLPPANDNDNTNGWEGIRLEQDDYFVVWARAGRLWGWNFDTASSSLVNTFDDYERAPRYIFSSHWDGFHENSDDFVTTSQDGKVPGTFRGDRYDENDSPDSRTDPWIGRDYTDASVSPAKTRTRKPTFFPCYTTYDLTDIAESPFYTRPPIVNGRFVPGGGTVLTQLADKGAKDNDDYFFEHSLQMLQKNDDFEQVGEVLNVWMYGHQLEINNAGTPFNPTDDLYVATTKTFSEFMSDARRTGKDERVNRLRTVPTLVDVETSGGGTDQRGHGQVIGIGPDLTLDPNSRHPNHAVPALPAGVRAMGLFVCDAGGVAPLTDIDGDGNANAFDLALRRFRNAAAYAGLGTPGLINVNTAPVEVLRALPHFYRIVHQSTVNDESGNPTRYLRTRFPEGIVQYRDRLGGDPAAPLGPNDPRLPAYGTRGFPAVIPSAYIPDMRAERGIADPAEILLVRQPGRSNPSIPNEWDASWASDFAGTGWMLDAFAGALDVDVSTDRINGIDDAGNLLRDEVARDVEERNLLYAGASSLISSRSDAFVVYFKVRNVRRDPVTGIWDGTNRDLILDESRYVMIVDRSRVNRPTDEPRILLLEKLPR